VHEFFFINDLQRKIEAISYQQHAFTIPLPRPERLSRVEFAIETLSDEVSTRTGYSVEQGGS